MAIFASLPAGAEYAKRKQMQKKICHQLRNRRPQNTLCSDIVSDDKNRDRKRRAEGENEISRGHYH